MEKTEVKKKSTFKKKVLRFGKKLRKLWSLFISELKSLGKKFTDLPKTTKYIIYVWVAVFIIVVALIFAGHNNNSFLQKYQSIENMMNEETLNYVKENSLYMSKDNKLKIDLEVLKEEMHMANSLDISDTCKENCFNDYDVFANKGECDGFCLLEYSKSKDDYLIEDTCEGFSLVYYDDVAEEYVVSSYINCGKYTTKEYSDYK